MVVLALMIFYDLSGFNFKSFMRSKKILVSAMFLLFASFCLYSVTKGYAFMKLRSCEWNKSTQPALFSFRPQVSRQIQFVDVLDLKDNNRIDGGDLKLMDEKEGFVFAGEGYIEVFLDELKQDVYDYSIWVYDLLPRSHWESWVNAIEDLPDLQGVHCDKITRAQYASIVNIADANIKHELLGNSGRLEWENGELVGQLFSNIYVDTKNRFILAVHKTIVSDRSGKFVRKWTFGQMRGNKGVKSFIYTLPDVDEKQMMEAFIRTAIAQLGK